MHSFPGNVRELENLQKGGYDQLVQKLERYWKNEIGEDPDEYNLSPVVFIVQPTLQPDAEVRKRKKYEEFGKALKLIQSDELYIKKVIRAYEIIRLYQDTTLSKGDIAKILRIRKSELAPAQFKSMFGIGFPNRENPYLISHPMDICPTP
jgi:DNA-binding NtrC family response regulator